MKSLKNKTLALFFTFDVSLKTWEEIGNLEREIKPYNELSKYFKKIYFITYGDTTNLKYREKLADNIKILPKKSILPSKIYQFFIPFIYGKELKETDIYKTNQMRAAVPAVISKWIYRKKLIVRCGYEWLSFSKKKKTSYFRKKIVSLIEKIAYKTSDRIVLTSQEDEKFVENKFKISPSKIRIVSNYIDASTFKPFPIEKEKNRIIFVGRLVEQKNLFNLIKAALETPAKLVIIGSGPLRKELEKFAEQKRAQVEFKDNIPNEKLPEELNKSEIFVLSSLYEGCPKTLLEAMSCRLPCIGTNVDGIKRIIRHKENGYLCEINASSIRKAIIELLNDKMLQQKLSRAARKIILENFSFEKIIKKELKIYEVL